MTLPAAAVATSVTMEIVADPLRRLDPDPGKWTIEDCEHIVQQQTADWMGVARRYVVDGDHWQDGLGWMGPKPQTSEVGYQETMTLIRDGFTSRNALAEIAKRYTNGCVGHEPSWALVPRRAVKTGEKPSASEQTLIDEAHAALTDWWDLSGVPSLFWQGVYQMSWGQRGPLRLFLSGEAFVPGTSIVRRPATLEEAFRLILLDVPKLEEAAVYTDPNTKREVGVYLFRDALDVVHAELVYQDANRRTVLRTVRRDPNDQTAPAPVRADLGGYLTHCQLVRPTRLLSSAAFDLQRALNLAMTVAPRTIVTAGFLERWLLNMKLPGKWVESAGGKKVWQPDANLRFGAGTTSIGMGEIIEDDQGKKSLAPADVKWREPSDVTGPINAADGIYAKLLEECAQAHILLSSEAAPSGRSRRESRGDYEASLEESKLPIERAGRWLMGAALGMVEYVMGTPGRYTKALRVRFTARLNAGPADPEDRAQSLAEWEKGARSIESVMIGAGIMDPDAEQIQISQEPGARLDIALRQAETATAWLDLGADVALAAEVAGIDPEIARRLDESRRQQAEQARKAARDANAEGDNGGTPTGGTNDAGDAGGEGGTGDAGGSE